MFTTTNISWGWEAEAPSRHQERNALFDERFVLCWSNVAAEITLLQRFSAATGVEVGGGLVACSVLGEQEGTWLMEAAHLQFG